MGESLAAASQMEKALSVSFSVSLKQTNKAINQTLCGSETCREKWSASAGQALRCRAVPLEAVMGEPSSSRYRNGWKS